MLMNVPVVFLCKALEFLFERTLGMHNHNDSIEFFFPGNAVSSIVAMTVRVARLFYEI